MKKIIPALLFALFALSCNKEQPLPPVINPWDDETLPMSERLSSLPDVISVTKMEDNQEFPQGVYDVRFKLPIDHKNPSAGTFSNKVFVAVKGTENHSVFLITGYSAMTPTESDQAVTSYFQCNQFCIAHREFVDAKTGTDYAFLGTDQAAADQKQVYDNLKLMFKKRMIFTGSSKGGICTALFAGYYPDVDAIYLPKVAPFCRTVAPTEGHSFILNEVGTPEVRTRLLNTQRKLLALKDNKTVMDEFKASVAEYTTDLSTSITDIFYYVIQDYAAFYWQNGGSELDIPDDELTGEDLWSAIQISSAFTSACKFRNNPYYIQALQELGSFGYLENMSDIYSPTQKSYLKALLPDRFHNLQHNGGATFDKYVDQAVSKTDKPMFFLYGGQDAWTQFALNDKYVNGKNIMKYTVPGATHSVDINNIPDADRQKVIDWFRSYLDK